VSAPTVAARIDAHERFWRGEGPCLILVPADDGRLYDLDDYPTRFHNPRGMWESEMRRAECVVDWPTDGIPTVRPNLGVVFVPSMAGLAYKLPEEQMPWPGSPLGRDAIRTARATDVAETEFMRLAEEFYLIHMAEGGDAIVAYHADTQGVFDVAHLLYGNEQLYELLDPGEQEWVEELMEQCAGSGTVLYSRLAGEPGEDWQAYVRRLARLAMATGARCILRPMVVPETRDACAAMCKLWHELTA